MVAFGGSFKIIHLTSINTITMDVQVLRELRIISKVTADNLEIELSELLNDYFQKFLRDAADRMVSEGRTSYTDIKEAKEACVRIIREMRPYKETRSGKKDIVNYQAFVEVKNSTGSLWPVL